MGVGRRSELPERSHAGSAFMVIVLSFWTCFEGCQSILMESMKKGGSVCKKFHAFYRYVNTINRGYNAFLDDC